MFAITSGRLDMAQLWQTVRVFISSTFRDMHSERDWLVKRVFPALRERLEKYRVHLIDIDLRWGVTEQQAESGGALDVCLEQIDACRPFFLGILGERYGWVPQQLPEQVTSKSKYGWIRHTTKKSITELEILYGVLNDPKMFDHAFFCYRDAAFIKDVPTEKQSDLRAEDDESAAKLSTLKSAIDRTQLPTPPLRNYPCRYAGLKINWRLAKLELNVADQQALEEVAKDGLVDPAEYANLEPHLRDLVHRFGTVQLEGLEEFGERVRDWLWESIRRQLNLPDQPPTASIAETDPLAEEQNFHDLYMESRTRVYVGREKVIRALTKFADGDLKVPCVVTGPSGSGKSAAMAKFVKAYRDSHPAVVIIPHFIGASPASTSLRLMLRRVCLTLKKEFGLADEVEQDPQRLIGQFKEFLGRVPADRRVLIVLDALNQLDETDNADQLHWLPWEFPAHVKIVISSIDDQGRNEPILKVLRKRNRGEFRIEALTDNERLQIVREVPSLSAKTLDDRQVRLLLKNKATQNPLFLLVALEELRGFGSFEQLNARIQTFPHEGDTVTALFIQVIERLELEFGAMLIRDVLTLLASARRGLSEQELQDLSKSHDRPNDLFAILRQLRPYLQPRGELIDFYHRNLFKAVQNNYHPNESALKTTHARLAHYFHANYLSDGSISARCLDVLPYHQTCAGMWQDLLGTLGSIDFLECKVRSRMLYALLDDFSFSVQAGNSLGEHAEASSEVTSFLTTLQQAFLLRIGTVSQAPDSLVQEVTIALRTMQAKSPRIDVFLDESAAHRDAKADSPWLCCKVAPDSVTDLECEVTIDPQDELAFSDSEAQILIVNGTGVIRHALDPKTMAPLGINEVQRRTLLLRGRYRTMKQFSIQDVDLSPPQFRKRTETGRIETKHVLLRRMNDGTLCVSLANGELLGEVNPCDAVALCPNKELVVTVGSKWQRQSGSRSGYMITTLALLAGRTKWLLYEGPQTGLKSEAQKLVLERINQRKDPSEAERRRREAELLKNARDAIDTENVFRVQRVSMDELGPKGFRSTMRGEQYSTAVSLSDDGSIVIGFSEGQILVTSVPGMSEADGEDLPWAPCETYHCAGPIQSCLLSRDGQRLYVLNAAGRLQLIRRRKKPQRAAGARLEVAYSTDGNWFAFKEADSVTEVIDRRDRQSIRLEAEWKEVGNLYDAPRRAAVFTPDSTRLLSVGDEHNPILYDLVDRNLTHFTDVGRPCSAVFSPGGRWLALLYSRCQHRHPDDHSLAMVDLAQMSTIWKIDEGCLTAAFHPHGNAVVVNSPNTNFHGATLIELNSGKSLRTFTVPGPDKFINIVTHVAMSPDGHLVALGTCHDNVVHVLNVASGESLAAVSLDSTSLRRLAFSPCGKFLTAVLLDQRLLVWSISGTLLSATRLLEEPVSLAWDPSGTTFTIGTDRGALYIFELRQAGAGPPVVWAVRHFQLAPDAQGGQWDQRILIVCPNCGNSVDLLNPTSLRFVNLLSVCLTCHQRFQFMGIVDERASIVKLLRAPQ